MTTLGSRLRRLREEKNITQLHAAKLIGISNVQLSRYESDAHKPDPETLAKLAGLYAVTTDFLISGMANQQMSMTSGKSNKQGLTESRQGSQSLPYLDTLANTTPQDMTMQWVRDVVLIPVTDGFRAIHDSFEPHVVGMAPVVRESIAGGEHFYLLVNDDDLYDDGIHMGDLALIQKVDTVDEGKIGLVSVDGQNVLLRRIYYADDAIILQAAHPQIRPLVQSQNSVFILGQVRRVMKEL